MSKPQPILQLESIRKNFGGLCVVEDLSFSVRRGTCTALIGPNGAGKTTVFNLITGVYPIDAGRVLLEGRDIGAMPSRQRIHHGIARNFQNVRLMPHLTALENVLIGQHCRNRGLVGVLQPINLTPRNRWREEARAALAAAGLARHERATVASLPYGLQKRIELVRALMAKPCLLLLDEPAAGLNPAETDLLRERLGALCAEHGITLLVVEHDMHFVGALCEQVIVLNFGRMIAEGTPDEIREHPLVREAYLGPILGLISRRRPRTIPSGAMRLELEDVHVRYGRVHAVRGISLAVAGREIVAVLGANGAGKSSLLKAVMGVAPIAQGRVILDGTDITAWPPNRRVQRQLILVPEGRRIVMSLSVHENLSMGAFARREPARVKAELEDIYARFPNLAQRRHLPACVLSGGEQQMLAIARAVLADPKLMLLDEPSLGLSPRLTAEVFALISELNRSREMGILLVEQNTHMALDLAERAYVLELGRKVMEGAPAQLRADPSLREAYLGRATALQTEARDSASALRSLQC